MNDDYSPPKTRNAAVAVPLALPDPRIPDAEEYGGIGAFAVANPNGSVLVIAGPYQAMAKGDRILFYWGDPSRPVASEIVSDEDEQNGSAILLRIRVPDILYVGEGSIPVFYEMRPFSGGPTQTSDTVNVIVKFTIPGGPDPNPSTPYLNENLAPADVPHQLIGEPEAGAGVDVTIKPWLHMYEGDVLTLSWGTERLRQPPLPASEVGKSQVITVTRETIERAGDGDGLVITYDVSDVVSNWSLWAPPTLVDVEIDPNRLAAPVVLDALDGTLDLNTLGASDVQILVSDGKIRQNDEIKLTWDGKTADAKPVIHEQTILARGPSTLLFVPNATALAIAYGTATVWYSLTPAVGGNTQPSRRTTISVIGRPLVLPAPTAEHVGPDGVLDPVDVPPSGEPVLVTYDMLPGDTVILRWRGRTNFDSEPKIVNRESSLSFNVPRATIIEGAAAPASIFYDVASDASDPTESQRLPVTVNEAQLRLPVPWVLEATGPNHDQLSIAAYYNAEYIIVQVRRYDDMAGADTVRVQWVAAVTYNTDVRPVGLPGHMDFRIPRMEVIDAIGRDVRISYSVQQRLGGPVHPSDTLTLHVEGQSLTLPAPLLDGARTQVTVLYSGMEDDQTVRVRWDGVVTRHTEIQRVVKGQPSIFDIPAAWVTENSGSRVLINYSVGWIDSDAQLQFSRVLRVNL
ncbi:hypothetical protein BTI_4144 [Burkholderia thailandensis MSMB121]|uniref:hypothetical protein n=2 Tax=Burkholderia humptydooensis TaxID=430531 RepID=UPI000327FCCA|nr:hypothetical protein [Burkholderia humptydooensis]AGK50090.1 hypothetical protein BTI_4144 [Burkholderia thailandensis MSMB121]